MGMESWQRTIRKEARRQGRQYLSSKGKVVQPKQPGPDCNCKKMCFEEVPRLAREAVFKEYYDLPTYEKQSMYLYNLMTIHSPLSKKENASKSRNRTVKYVVRYNGSDSPVCKRAFLNIFGITHARVLQIFKDIERDDFEDCRGAYNKPNHRILTPGEEQDVINFICRKLTERCNFCSKKAPVSYSRLTKAYNIETEGPSISAWRLTVIYQKTFGTLSWLEAMQKLESGKLKISGNDATSDRALGAQCSAEDNIRGRKGRGKKGSSKGSSDGMINVKVKQSISDITPMPLSIGIEVVVLNRSESSVSCSSEAAELNDSQNDASTLEKEPVYTSCLNQVREKKPSKKRQRHLDSDILPKKKKKKEFYAQHNFDASVNSPPNSDSLNSHKPRPLNKIKTGAEDKLNRDTAAFCGNSYLEKGSNAIIKEDNNVGTRQKLSFIKKMVQGTELEQNDESTSFLRQCSKDKINQRNRKKKCEKTLNQLSKRWTQEDVNSTQPIKNDEYHSSVKKIDMEMVSNNFSVDAGRAKEHQKKKMKYRGLFTWD